eukprot:6811434-Prymnesium_polylepis.1
MRPTGVVSVERCVIGDGRQRSTSGRTRGKPPRRPEVVLTAGKSSTWYTSQRMRSVCSSSTST